MDEFKSVIGIVAYAVEGFGVLVMLVGCALATARFLGRVREAGLEPAYRQYRRDVGHSIILGLEFLIAGDVIRTVIVSHSPTDVAVLGLIVVVRAFLSFSLTLEVEGRWPWQAHAAGAAQSDSSSPASAPERSS